MAEIKRYKLDAAFSELKPFDAPAIRRALDALHDRIPDPGPGPPGRHPCPPLRRRSRGALVSVNSPVLEGTLMTDTLSQPTNTPTTMSDILTINGVDYVRADSVPAAKPNGNRAVIVVDRGWIFAGDVTREDGRIRLTRAVWIFRWESCGFAKVIEDPSKADIRPMADVDIPAGAEIFCVPVSDQWGL